jgi:hypothetical protein
MRKQTNSTKTITETGFARQPNLVAHGHGTAMRLQDV